ncbi:MAG: cysteine desulfurase family protein [Candidatus Pacebacteria bacterium]|nr:cysteine desulfurase family protein [Candidatus Paceibacterota bacterium]
MWFSKSSPARVYLDHASATPLLHEAAEAMREAEKLVGNPGAIHAEAVAAKNALNDARERIALLLGVKARELVFTSGLTEANNLAIVGFARRMLVDGFSGQGRTLSGSLDGTHWIVSAIEHSSVLECFSEIERLGGSVTHVSPNEKGIITPESIVAVLKPETVFVSVGWANNEIGSVQPLGKIAQAIRLHEEKHGTRVIFHADAGQAPLYEPTVAHSLGVDLLSISASKLYGPHGVGCLYLSNRTNVAGVVLGGKQERELRAGTENVALAVGFAAAFELVARERHDESKRLKTLRDALARELSENTPGLVINGDLKHALPHMLNISIPDIHSEYLTLALDHEGFAVSTKSACNEGQKASHVVEALGAELWRAENTLRISLGRATTRKEITHFRETFSRLLSHAIVPAWTSRS